MAVGRKPDRNKNVLECRRQYEKVLIAIMVLLAVAAVPSFAQKIKIGVSIPTADHGWTGGINYYAQKAIKDWQAKDKNIEFYLVTADSPAKQVNDVEDLMVKGIDALVILAHDSAPLTPVVKKAYEKGIYVVSVDVGSPRKYRMSTSQVTTPAWVVSPPNGSVKRLEERVTSSSSKAFPASSTASVSILLRRSWPRSTLASRFWIRNLRIGTPKKGSRL